LSKADKDEPAPWGIPVPAETETEEGKDEGETTKAVNEGKEPADSSLEEFHHETVS